jgi:AAA domain/Bifunctional DNA primase/polymerase, N-terminal/Primase C terminal 1 (PriCT-1)
MSIFLEQIIANGQAVLATLQPQVAQPNQDGEFESPADGAIWMAIVHGKRQTPLQGKAAFLPNWQETATTDSAQIRKYAEEHPGCNFGSIADDGEIFEVDSPEVRKRFAGSFSSTLTISSSEGKWHGYYLPADVEHIGQNGTKQGDFSLRKHNAYCVSPGSVHPGTKRQYRVTGNHPMTLPSSQEIAFWNSEKKNQKTPVVSLDAPIPDGQRNSTITSILGKARQQNGLEYDALLALARQHNQRCSPPLSESELETIAHSIARYEVKQAPPVILGGQVLGLPAAPPQPVDWRENFKTVGELEKGDVRMLIRGFLPEGTTFIGGLPGEGKTLFALSIAKALTSLDPFLGKFFVEEQVPVIYLIPESSSRAFRARCEKFRIPDDPTLFVCRTVSEGATLPLDDESLFQAVRELKPVVILDTFIRFSDSDDENDAAQNKKIVNDIIRLRQAGAVAVIGLHHAKKDIRQKGMSLESVLRGTGDIAASCDAAYGLLRDQMLYNNGKGPNEIEVSCVKPRDFEPPAPFRIAATRRPEARDGELVFGMPSVIDEYHDFTVTNPNVSEQRATDSLVRMVEQDPAMTLLELEKATGMSSWAIRQALKKAGWTRPRGGSKGGATWSKPVPVTGAVTLGKAAVTFDLPGQRTPKTVH